MPTKHLVNSQDLSREDYDEIFRRFRLFVAQGIPPNLCAGKVVATLFFQPSTRTMAGFQSAMLRAGGGWVGVTGEQGISMEKGESFTDTIREYGNFADCIVLRHPDDDSAERAAAVSFVPVINAGSGSREHAVGAAMVLAEIFYHLKRPLEGAKIGLYGTPEINRASKAIVPILGRYSVELFIDDLGHFPLPAEVEERAKANGLKTLSYGKLDDFLGEVDVLFVTRGLQKGIIPEDKFPPEKAEAILRDYKPITKDHVSKMRPDAILFMIKPRIFEIEPEVDADPRAVYAQPEHYSESCLAVMTYLLDIEI